MITWERFKKHPIEIYKNTSGIIKVKHSEGYMFNIEVVDLTKNKRKRCSLCGYGVNAVKVVDSTIGVLWVCKKCRKKHNVKDILNYEDNLLRESRYSRHPLFRGDL
jgi:hypothetical protein